MIKIICVLGLMSVFFTGCWDQKVMQDIHYVTCIGVDYKDEQYQVYTQFFDFNSVAKTEQGKPSETVPIWLGSGKGRSFDQALTNLYESAQQPLAFSHMTSFIVSENVLKKGITDVLDGLNRYPETRYTMWMFGTREDLKEMLILTPIFNLSPLTLITHQPKDVYRMMGNIQPLQGQEFSMGVRDPGSTVLLPSLKIVRKWYEGAKEHSLPEVDGAYVLKQHQYQKWVSAMNLKGYRWISHRPGRIELYVNLDTDRSIGVSFSDLKTKILSKERNGKLSYSLQVKGKGMLIEQLEQIKNIDQLVNQTISEEIRTTYLYGLKSDIDIFNLENHTYHMDNKLWKETFQKQHITLQKNMLDSILVDVKVLHPGKLRMNIVEKK